jgi:hypothetical protein
MKPGKGGAREPAAHYSRREDCPCPHPQSETAGLVKEQTWGVHERIVVKAKMQPRTSAKHAGFSVE